MEIENKTKKFYILELKHMVGLHCTQLTHHRVYHCFGFSSVVCIM